jgi:hypothetical protein
VRWRLGLGKRGGGRPRGSPRSRFDGLEGGVGGPSGAVRRRPAPAAAAGKIPASWGGFGQCAAGAASSGYQGGAVAVGWRQMDREGALTEQLSWRPAAA